MSALNSNLAYARELHCISRAKKQPLVPTINSMDGSGLFVVYRRGGHDTLSLSLAPPAPPARMKRAATGLFIRAAEVLRIYILITEDSARDNGLLLGCPV